MARITSSIRLARVAAPLRPVKAPFYVRPPVPPGLEDTYPAAGWYWIPAGAPTAVFLAHNEPYATVVLHEQLRRITADVA